MKNTKDSVNATRSQSALDVLWQSEALIAVNKPAGILSQGGSLDGERTRGGGDPNLVDMAKAMFRVERAGVLHRLDRNVSGIVLIALSHDIAEAMSKAFATGAVERRYEAVVRGRIAEDERTIDAPLLKDARTNLVRVAELAEPNAKPSLTKLRVRSRFQAPMGRLMELDLWPITGRSHQLRAHLQSIACPMVGDPKYGVPARGVHRPLLHATEVAFIHPLTKEAVRILCPAPWESAALRLLRR
jgi:RluA family pseudouridine synthase